MGKAIRRDFAQIGNKIMRKGVHVESSLQGGIFERKYFALNLRLSVDTAIP